MTTRPSFEIRTVRLLVASAGNDFMIEIARILAEGFVQAGAACQVAIDQIPSPQPDDCLQLVVAPHEYFPLFMVGQTSQSQHDELVRRVYVLNVEQPGSQWFELGWKYARASRGVLDISLDGVREFTRRGIPATHLPLGYSRLLEAEDAPDPRVRPIDVLFLGHDSPRRAEFLARHADFFTAHECRLVLTDSARPRRTDTAGYFSGDSRAWLLGRSKILLNVHSSERPYFETHRAVLALSNRCLLVSEQSRETRPFVDGCHFVSAPLDELPALCARFLSNPDALAAIALEGHRFAKAQLDVSATCRALLASLAPGNGRAPIDLDVITAASRAEEPLRQALRERLARSLEARATGKHDWTAIPNAAYGAICSPAVTVVVTLYNYARFVGECLSSVFSSRGVAGGFEIVVVDDASTDTSAACAQAVLERSSRPALLVSKHSNTGLADARNLGLRLARGRYVFVLDADNWIYPGCLEALRAAISSGGEAAVYGLIRRFDEETSESLGLLSSYDWDVRELVRGPYIDAMALFDRQVLAAVGGYSTELIEYGWFGWEDYDLWLKLARAGYRCKLVPNILSAYRVHPGSMLQRTNRSSDAFARYFQQKFRELADEFPDMDRYFGFPASRHTPSPVAPTETHDGSNGMLARCLDLERELTEVYASKSWQVTAPLRLVYRYLTGRPS
jgi:glycosyltransferase involved in cell wall biosynthesis